jgi:hypothetical protein
MHGSSECAANGRIGTFFLRLACFRGVLALVLPGVLVIHEEFKLFLRLACFWR